MVEKASKHTQRTRRSSETWADMGLALPGVWMTWPVVAIYRGKGREMQKGRKGEKSAQHFEAGLSSGRHLGPGGAWPGRDEAAGAAGVFPGQPRRAIYDASHPAWKDGWWSGGGQEVGRGFRPWCLPHSPCPERPLTWPEWQRKGECVVGLKKGGKRDCEEEEGGKYC